MDSALSAAAALARALDLGVVGSGGVTLDLGGGVFKLSRPAIIRGAGGWTMWGGSLIADASNFTQGGCLLDVAQVQNLGFVELTLDGNLVACGARFDGVVQITVDRVFFLHYLQYGIFGDDGKGASHELMVTTSFFAERMWGEPGFDNIDVLSGTAIWLSSQFYDSQFANSIIRCTRVGIVNMAGANLFLGLHVYATCNKNPDAYNVSVGLVQSAWGQTRILASYWDDSPLIITRASEATIKDNLFYGLSGLIFAPQQLNFSAVGVQIQGNVFTSTGYSGAGPKLHYETANGTVNSAALSDFVVADNSIDVRSTERSTRVAASVAAGAEAAVGGGAPVAAGGVAALRAALLGAVFNTTVDLRGKLLFVPGGAAPAFEWRRAAAPALAQIAAAEAKKGGRGERARREPAVNAATAVASAFSAAAAFGGVIAQLQATAVLTALTLGSGAAAEALPLVGSGLAPITAVYPVSDSPGVLAVSVGTQVIGSVSAAWAEAAAAALERHAARSSAAAAMAGWQAALTISADQAAPTQG